MLCLTLMCISHSESNVRNCSVLLSHPHPEFFFISDHLFYFVLYHWNFVLNWSIMTLHSFLSTFLTASTAVFSASFLKPNSACNLLRKEFSIEVRSANSIFYVHMSTTILLNWKIEDCSIKKLLKDQLEKWSLGVELKIYSLKSIVEEI